MKNFYTFLFALMITGLGFSQTTIFNEGGGGSAPTNWTFQNNVGTNDIDKGTYWLVDPGNPSDFIITDTYDLSSYTDAEFTLDVASFSSGSYNPAKIEISFDGGSNYTQTETSTTTTGSSYIDGGTFTLNSVTSQVVIRISNNGTSGRGVRLRNLELTASGVATPSCTTPTTQATAYNTTSLGTTSATLNWTDGDGDEVLVVVKADSAVDTDPSNGTDYTGNTVFGLGDVLGTGNYVVQSGSATSSVSITGLSEATTYYVAVYEYNTTDTCYELTELTGNFTTGCSTPSDVTAFTATAGNTEVELSWTNGACYDDILVVAKATSAVTVTPTGDGTAYTANAAFGSGTDLGTNEYAVYKGSGTSVTVTGLTNGTTYHFEVFARKDTTWSSGVTDSAAPFDQLGAGDIAFVAFNADGDDDFAFVTLADIPANTTIWFTDNEWDGNSFNNTNEGEIEWSHTSILPAGSVIIIEDTGGTSPSVNIGTVSGGSVNLGASDEQLFALLSTPSASTMATPGFLAGISNDITGSTLTGSGLTEGTDFLNFGDDADGYAYTGSRSSETSFADYLPLIMNTANWQIETSDGTNILPISTTVFTLSSSCTAPTTQASAYNTTSLGNTTATLNWTSGDGDEVLVVVKEGSAVDTDPTSETSYTGNTVFGSGDEIGTGNYAVYSGITTNSVSITGLDPSTTYHIAVYEYNTLDTCYDLDELTGDFTTDCSTPSDVTAFSATSGDTEVDLSWTNGICFDEILVVAKATSAVTVTPTGDGTAYTANAVFGSGTDLGTNEYAVYKGTGTSVTITGLTNGTTYHFEVFARKVTTWSAGVTDSATPNLVEEAVAGDLIITEVSGDASAAGNDNGYMEIYNRSNKIINLDNIEVRYYNTNPNSPSDTVTLSGTLSPGGYIIFTQNGGAYTTEYSDTADALGGDFFFNGGDDGCDVYHTTNGVIDQFNDNGSSQSPWNWSDSFTYNRNSSNSGALEDSWTQDGTETPRTKPNLYFWTGASDNSWTNAGNWDEGAEPLSTTNVVITDQTNEPLISTAAQVSFITIETSSSATIEKTGSLEALGNLDNNGDLSLESDSNEYSSLIVQGAVSGTGTTEYNRYVNNNDSVNGNDLISAPLSGQAFNTFIANNPNIRSNPSGPEVLFGGFDNDSSTNPFELWNDTDTTPLTAGKGYRSGITEGEASNLVTFEGTVSNGLVQTAINQGTVSKLNLIGNPFPSYLDAQQFLSHNASLLDPSALVIYGYNDSTDGTSAGDYTIISALLNTGMNIAPGQGFFVASGATGGNIEFTTTSSDMRLAAGGDDFIAGRDSSVISNLKLNLSNDNANFITDIFFTEFSTLGLDPGYDASLLGGAAPSFALYSELIEDNTGIPFAVQALGKTDYLDVTIPLGVNANQGEQITFSINETNLPSTIDIYLDDTVENTSTLLNTSDYVMTPIANLSGVGRFYLRFSESTLSTSNHSLDNISIYTNANDKTAIIAGQLLENTTAYIYDIQGRVVSTTILDSTSSLQSLDTSHLTIGIYVIQLTNGTQNKTQKVIIR